MLRPRASTLNETPLYKELRRLAGYRFLLQGAPPEVKFALIMAPRSGSNLLRDLLNNHPQIVCDGEILSSPLPFPYAFAEARSRADAWGKKGVRAYGFKFAVWQLSTIQKRDPASFVRALQGGGWRLMSLQRKNLLRQEISLVMAKHRKALGHKEPTRLRKTDAPLKLAPVRVDVARLLAQMTSADKEWRGRQKLLDGLPHLALSYEDDLLVADRHQDTANKAFAFLGLPPATVDPQIVKTGRRDLSAMIENYDELERALLESDFASMLDAP